MWDTFHSLSACIHNTVICYTTNRSKGSKDLGYFWFGYIRMLGHLQMGAYSAKIFQLTKCIKTYKGNVLTVRAT